MNENEYKQAVADLTKATDQVKKFADTCQAEMKNLGELTKETKVSADKALTEMNAMAARLTDLEQKGARRGNSEDLNNHQTAGEIFINSNEAKSSLASGQRTGMVRVEMERKALTTGTDTVGTGTSPSTSLVPSMRLPDVQLMRFRSPTMRNLIPGGNTTSGSIEYPQETGFTNNAAVVPEGTSKPYSDINFDLKRANVATIAHLFKHSKQLLEDFTQLQSVINNRASLGLRIAEEKQFLYGDGNNANLLGLMKQAVPFAAPAGLTAPGTAIDMLRMAMLQAVLAEYPASAIVLNDVDWYKITSVKDTLGRYLIGDPQSVAPPVLWGLPVSVSKYIQQGDFLTGAFADGAQIFDRSSIAIEVGYVNDDFEKNLISIRAEERTALVVYRPEAFVRGTLVTDAPSGG